MPTFIKPRIIPSYHNTWARSRTESAFPELWKGKIAHWVPALGPTGGTLFDVSGQGRDGTLFTGLTVHKVDVLGPLIDLDGLDDYIQFGDIVLANNLTVSAWIFPKGNIGEFNNILGDDASTDFLRLSGGTVATFEADNVTTAVTHGHTFVADEWQLFTLVREGGTLSFYRNAVPPTTTGTNTDIFTPERIGQKNDGDFFQGAMNDIRIYDRALSPAEVKLLYEIPYADLIPKSRILGNVPGATVAEIMAAATLDAPPEPTPIPIMVGY